MTSASTTNPDASRSLHDAGSWQTVSVDGQPVTLWTLRLASTMAPARRFLLLHGNPSHLGHFAANVDFFRARGDVALLDLPGFGRSPAPRGPLSLDHLADVAAAHAVSLGWTGAVDVVGQSHGGAVAQTLAVRHPALVRSLVLLGTMAFPAHTSMRLAMLPGAASVMVGLVRHGRRLPGLMRAIAHLGARVAFAPDPVPAGLVEDDLALTLATPEIQRSSIRANDGDPTRQLARQASQVRAPVLLVHGRGDRLVPLPHARRLFDRLGAGHPRSRMVELDGGHMLHLIHPAEVHRAIGPWLDGLDG